MEQPDFTPKIEIIGPDNWQEYQEFRLRALRNDPTAFGASYEDAASNSEEDIRKMLASSDRKDYVVRINGKIVAAANYTLVIPSNVRHNAKFHAVAVDPEYREKGLAHSLIKRMIDDLHNNSFTSKITLMVNASHDAPVNLYKKLGFKEFGRATKEIKFKGEYYDDLYMELIFEDKL